MTPPVNSLSRAARILLLVSFIACQSASLRAERLPVRTYTSADGLGSSFVSSVMRDSRGFLWFCTRDGLSRFDGSHFVTYQIGGLNAPPGIEQIIETRKGVYWIATTGGLYRFDPQANPVGQQIPGAVRTMLNAEMVSTSRGVLYEDRAGNLWVGSNGLYRLQETDGKVIWQKTELKALKDSPGGFFIATFWEAKDGSLWIATTRGLLRRLPDGREVLFSKVSAHASVAEDQGNRIWLAGEAGVYVINPQSMTEMDRFGDVTTRRLDDLAQVQTSTSKEIRLPEKSGEIFKYMAITGLDTSNPPYLYRTTDDHIWIAGGGGPIEFDGRTFRSYTAAQGLTGGLGQLVEDLSGNLWLGGPNGLARLNRQGLTTYDEADGLKSSAIEIINEGRDGTLYATSIGFLISQFDGHGFHTIRPRVLASARTSWSSNYVFLDSRNEWWFLTTEGLHHFAAQPNVNALARARPLSTYTSGAGLKSNVLFHIFEDSKSDLWISTTGNSQEFALSKWNRANEGFETFPGAEDFPAGRAVSSFAEDRFGNLWFGFYKGGLMRYRDGHFTEFTIKDGLPDGLITALHLDRSGRIWVASSLGGLSRIDDLAATPPGFVTYATDNGLASNNIRSLTEDLFGNIYAGSARGVDRLSPDGLRIKHYSVNDGLAADFVYAAFRDRNGVLWFGTSGGLSRLVPQLDKETLAPSVWLAGLRVAGESRPVPALGSKDISGLELTHRQNSLQIDFFAIDFKEGENLRYQYMMESDKNWGPPSSQRTVNYANLAPGAYRFLVRAVNADGIVSAQPATISFRILPPIWQRWWFITLALGAFGGVIYAAYRYRLAQLLKVERVRTRIATDLHDDIGASLSRMALLSEVVKDRRGSGEQSDRMLTDIAESARGLVDSMADIVWSIDPRRDNLRSLVLRLREFASDTFEPAGIRWELNAPADLERIGFSPGQRRHIYLIFKEAITNISRYAECGSAWLSLRVVDGQLVGEVSDDGCGFDPLSARPDGQRGGNGLRNMKSRAAELGGRLEIESTPGQGTTLKLIAPMK
jgi:ligand-binding sensor domain-containing protein/two-component sensor histidine kinase